MFLCLAKISRGTELTVVFATISSWQRLAFDAIDSVDSARSMGRTSSCTNRWKGALRRQKV